MPLYDFECKCGEHFEEFLSMEKAENPSKNGIVCPKCSSKKVKRIITGFSFGFADPVGTDRWANSHNYRFWHNYERPGGLREQRLAREKTDHMGPTPYTNIDDISSGKHFGEVQ